MLSRTVQSPAVIFIYASIGICGDSYGKRVEIMVYYPKVASFARKKATLKHGNVCAMRFMRMGIGVYNESG